MSIIREIKFRFWGPNLNVILMSPRVVPAQADINHLIAHKSCWEFLKSKRTWLIVIIINPAYVPNRQW